MQTLLAGSIVHHFTNPDYRCVVLEVIEPKACGEYGYGNWNSDGTAFCGCALLVLSPLNSDRVFREFAIYWDPTPKEGSN